MRDFHTQCATHAGIRSSVTSTAPFATASQASGTLSYPLYPLFLRPNQPEGCSGVGEEVESHSFGTMLDPRWIVGALTHSTSELLRTL